MSKKNLFRLTLCPLTFINITEIEMVVQLFNIPLKKKHYLLDMKNRSYNKAIRDEVFIRAMLHSLRLDMTTKQHTEEDTAAYTRHGSCGPDEDEAPKPSQKSSMMRRSHPGTACDRNHLVAPPTLESRWDPTKYNPKEVYGELAELFAKLRNKLGPHLQQYLSLVKQYIKQSLSLYELGQRIEKLLSGDSLSLHEVFVQALSNSCHLVTVTRSLNDILTGNVKSESQKDYIPHISSINALIILRSLEYGWAAPDPVAGQLIGDAVRTMLADRIDAAVHVRRSPNTNKIGFRSSFDASRSQLKNPFHQITVADLFNSFSVRSHFLGAETGNLLQLKCHSNFYEKLKSATENYKDKTVHLPTTKDSQSSTLDVVEEVVVNESFSNLDAAAAHTCISLPVSVCLSPMLCSSVANHEASVKSTFLPIDDELPISARKNKSQGCVEGALRNTETVSNSLPTTNDGYHGATTSAVAEPLLELKGKSVKRRRESTMGKSGANIGSGSLSAMLQPKSARLEVIELSTELTHTIGECCSGITDGPTERARFSRSSAKELKLLRHKELKPHSVQSLMDESDSNADEPERNLPKDREKVRHKKESKRKIVSNNRSARVALTHSESEVHSVGLVKGTVYPTSFASSGVMDKNAVQRAQAIIDAWKSSSYEVVPAYVDELSRSEGGKCLKGTRAKASTNLAVLDCAKGQDIGLMKNLRKKTVAEEKARTVLDLPLSSDKESFRKAKNYKSLEDSFGCQSSPRSVKTSACSSLSPRGTKRETSLTGLVKGIDATTNCSLRSDKKIVDFCSENALSTPVSSQEGKQRMSPPEEAKRRKSGVSVATPSLFSRVSKVQKSQHVDIAKKGLPRRSQRSREGCVNEHQGSSEDQESKREQVLPGAEMKLSLGSKTKSESKKEKKFEQSSKLGMTSQKRRKPQINKQQRDLQFDESSDDYQQSRSLERHVSVEVPTKFLSKRTPKDKSDNGKTTRITLRSSSHSSIDIGSQPSALVKNENREGHCDDRMETITKKKSRTKK